MYQMDVSCTSAFLALRPRVFSHALGYGARRGSPVHDGASMGPSRDPWRMLWAFKVAKSGK